MSKRILLVCACAFPLFSAGATAVAEPGYSTREHALVMAFFERIQQRSFELNAELCGYVLRDDDGHLRMTGPYMGEESSCAAPWPNWGEPIASWHTHGAHSSESYNEVPSDTDVESDHDEEVDGWVATPGGRLWHIDGLSREITLVCGRDCLPSDPNYDPADTGSIASHYDFEELLERLEE